MVWHTQYYSVQALKPSLLSWVSLSISVDRQSSGTVFDNTLTYFVPFFSTFLFLLCSAFLYPKARSNVSMRDVSTF